MSKSLRPVIVVFIIFAAVAAVVGVSKLMAPKEIIPWRTDFAAAEQESKTTHKPVFAYFTAEWCGPCQSLKQTLWADRTVEAALRNFYPVKIDIDANPALRTQFQIESIPQFVILDPNGQLVKTSTGVISTEEFLNFVALPQSPNHLDNK